MSNSFLGPLAALLTSVTWVLGSFAYAQLGRKYHPHTINFNRALMAVPFLFMLSLQNPEEYLQVAANTGPFLRQVAWLALGITSSYGFADAFFIYSANKIGIPGAQAISAIYPVWASFIGMIVLQTLPRTNEVVGMAMAVAGTLFIILWGRNTNQNFSFFSLFSNAKNAEPEAPTLVPTTETTHYQRGLLAALGTSCFWAMNSFASFKGGQGFTTAFANFFRMGIGLGVCALFILIVQGRDRRFFLEKEDYQRFGFFIFLEAFGGGFLYLYGMTHSSITVGATLASLAPVFAIPLSILTKQEKFSLAKTLATLFIVAGGALLVIG